MNFKAIFFDLDGVLVCSEERHFESWKRLLRELGVELPNRFYRNYIGSTDLDMAEKLSVLYKLSDAPKKLCELKRALFLETVSLGFPAPRGRDALLKELQSSRTLIVVSSSSRAEVEAILEAENIRQYFSHVIASEDTLQHKPDPMPYLLALRQSGVCQHEALVIEDSPAGVMSAVHANLTVAGIASSFISLPDFPGVHFYHSFYDLKGSGIFEIF